MSISKKAVLEIQMLSAEAESLAKGSASDRARASVLCQRVSTIKEVGLSSEECRELYGQAATDLNQKRYAEELFRYLTTPGVISEHELRELRDIAVGQQTISWTMGPQGGFSIPLEYEAKTREALAQMDPLLSANVTDFSMENSTTLQPSILQGFDLSAVTATLVGE